MITYITAFIFYTLAMVGILLVGFIVYKKMQINQTGENKGMIKIVDSVVIAPKKTLLVIKVRNEKFLIASGAEHTTFLSKLEDETAKRITAETNANKQIQDFNSKRESFLDLPKRRNDIIQKQFQELMEEDNDEQIQTQNIKPTKKDILNRILNELNSADTTSGSRY